MGTDTIKLFVLAFPRPRLYLLRYYTMTTSILNSSDFLYILDINDPVQLSNLPIASPLTISENTALATAVYTVLYSDIDTSQAHTFTMTSSPTSGSTYFSIDSSCKYDTDPERFCEENE